MAGPDEQTPHDTETRPESHLGEGLEEFGRVARGLAARLLGTGVVGSEEDLAKPAISPEVDQAITDAGDTLGRWLGDMGRGLKRRAGTGEDEQDLESEEDDAWSPLARGAKSFGQGLGQVAEQLLDQVSDGLKTTGEE